MRTPTSLKRMSLGVAPSGRDRSRIGERQSVLPGEVGAQQVGEVGAIGIEVHAGRIGRPIERVGFRACQAIMDGAAVAFADALDEFLEGALVLISPGRAGHAPGLLSGQGLKHPPWRRRARALGDDCFSWAAAGDSQCAITSRQQASKVLMYAVPRRRYLCYPADRLRANEYPKQTLTERRFERPAGSKPSTSRACRLICHQTAPSPGLAFADRAPLAYSSLMLAALITSALRAESASR